jgi:hypothetical protein
MGAVSTCTYNLPTGIDTANEIAALVSDVNIEGAMLRFVMYSI